MDAPGLDAGDLALGYRDLERLSAVGLAYAPTIQWLSRIAKGRSHLSVLDVGSGRGGLLRRIAGWARRRGVAVDLVGVDANPVAREIAEAATDPSFGIRYRVADVFELGQAARPDVIISCHVAHHLADAELVQFLRWMQVTARVGWHINDLHRHAIAERGVGMLARAMRLHNFVTHDGPVSVRRASKSDDWARALAAAGLDGAAVEVRGHAPFRWSVGTRV